jgi:hypothetical protein
MKEIHLTRGKVALVDDEDYERVVCHKWYARPSHDKKTWYAIHDVKIAKYRWVSMGMHRLILNAPNGLDVDHRNHDGLDNQKNNLRLCSEAQNNYNTRRSIANRSGFKGVHWHSQCNKWRARIVVKHKGISLGCFFCIKKAVKAYDEAAKHYFGEFAYLNLQEKEGK